MTDDGPAAPARGRRATRSDHAANHTAILDAAEQRFARDGIDVSLRAIATDAGVGIATFYRHFPDRHALVAEVFGRAGGRVEAEVGEALRTEGSGWHRIEHGLNTIVAIVTAHPTLYLARDWLLRHDPAFRGSPSWAAELIAAVELAHREGALRRDVEASDIAMIPFLLAPIASFPEPVRSLVAARQLAVMLRGMRTEADAIPMPGAPLTPAAVDELAQLPARERDPSDG